MIAPDKDLQDVELLTAAAYYHYMEQLDLGHTFLLGEPLLPNSLCTHMLKGVAQSANAKAAPGDLPRRGFIASKWLRLTARRFRGALASVGIGIPLRAPVFALGTVGVGPLIREEVFLHLVDDATRDLALTAPTPTA